MGILGQRFKHLVNEGKEKMILTVGLIHLPIVNTHMPTHDSFSRNKLIDLILYNCHSPSLGHNIDLAYPLTIQNRVDNTSLKQF